MTVKEVLKLNADALEKLRIPMGEPELYHTINRAVNDLQACVNALEQIEQAAMSKAQEKEEDVPEELTDTEEENQNGTDQ